MAVWTLILAPQAFAYLDPGTGSLIVQSVVAALAAAGFALRLYWRRVQYWLGRSTKRPDPASDEPRKPSE
jgi:hypothetical protein